MGLLDKLESSIKDLLFEQEEGKPPTEGGGKGTPDASTTKYTPPSSEATADAVAKYRNALLESIQKGKQPADILCIPFMKTLKSLESTIADEATRIKVAFTTGESYGVNPAAVTASSQTLKAQLADEQKKFSQTLEREAVSKVKLEETDVADIDKQLQQKNTTVQDLLKEIEALKTERAAKLTEINEAKGKIEAIRRDFTQAAQRLAGEFDELIQKINKCEGAKK
jgi:chromosome segregation ATPase